MIVLLLKLVRKTIKSNNLIHKIKFSREYNEMVEIDNKLFSDLSNLIIIRLDGNKQTRIHSNLFKRLDKIEILELENIRD